MDSDVLATDCLVDPKPLSMSRAGTGVGHADVQHVVLHGQAVQLGGGVQAEGAPAGEYELKSARAQPRVDRQRGLGVDVTEQPPEPRSAQDVLVDPREPCLGDCEGASTQGVRELCR